MNNSKIAIKKITKTGSGSANVLLPKKMLKDLGINFSDFVTVEMKENQIIIKKMELKG